MIDRIDTIETIETAVAGSSGAVLHCSHTAIDPGKPALPELRKAAKAHADPDVRLRAIVLGGKIEKSLGLVQTSEQAGTAEGY